MAGAASGASTRVLWAGLKPWKRAGPLLLALGAVLRAAALPSFDPLADASAAGGTTYANGAALYGQTNALGEGWARWNGGNTAFQVVCTNTGLSYGGFPAGFPEPSLLNAVYLPGQLDRAGGVSGQSAALRLSRSIKADPNNAVTNTLYASFLLKVPHLGNLSTNAPIYFGGFAPNTADQNSSLPASAMKIFLKGNAATGVSTTWSVGVANNSGANSAVWDSGGHSSNHVVFVVVAYEFGIHGNPDMARLWVSPAAASFGALAPPPPTASTAGITGAERIDQAASFFLVARSGGTLWGGLLVSTLRLGTSWSYVTGGPEVPPQAPPILTARLAGTNLVVSATNGNPGVLVSVLSGLLTLPRKHWLVSSNYSFDATGRLSVTNGLVPTFRQQYYMFATTGQTLHNLLDSACYWFLNNPPDADGSNFNARWQQTALVDQYGWQLSTTTWKNYRSAWNSSPSTADSLESGWPILYYLRQAGQRAYAEIRSTPVTHGFVLWHLYNMGYVVKTKDKCFALDLVARDAGKLASLLDFAICSHSHTDHYDANFLNAMVAAGKRVFSPFYSKGTVITSTSTYSFGEVTVRFTRSSQEPDVPVIISEINLGPGAGNYTIYDIADARPLTDLNPTQHINLFILHISNGLNIFDAVARVSPDATLYGHEMELGHAVGDYRWSYDYAYSKIRNQPHARSYILTWGERIDRR